MSAPRPTFRVMKNGYDRFAVDDAIEQYAASVERLEKKAELYERKIQELNNQMDSMKQEYLRMKNSSEAEKQAADNIARISLREANEIIATAQKNADMIIHEAILTARLILADLARLYSDANHAKNVSTKQLEDLLHELEEFEMPKMPDLRWLEEAEKKMQ